MFLHYTTAGESHGPQLTVILEGMPAGLEINTTLINQDLARRQIPIGAGGRMSIEHDTAEITAGVLCGKTTGAPIAIQIKNADATQWHERSVPAYTVPRPGHADYAAVAKYGFDDVRYALERASARETACRVAMGAICRALLRSCQIEVTSNILSIGGKPYDEQVISEARKQGETLGGVIACHATGLPVGLGSYVSADRRLDARLGAALLSIPAIKGVEIGPAFENTTLLGTQVHDAITQDGRLTNRCGGLEGGMTTGQPLEVHVAMKPIPTTIKPQHSIDLATGKPTETVYERSDVCPVPRACVVVESMVAFVLADALLEKLGGDSISVQKDRFAQLPSLSSIHLSPEPKVFWP